MTVTRFVNYSLLYNLTGSLSSSVSTLSPVTLMLSAEESNSTEPSINSNTDNDNFPLWMILMDQSQLVMTIIGLIANMATTLTLIKNGQVGRIILKIVLQDFHCLCASSSQSNIHLFLLVSCCRLFITDFLLGADHRFYC